MNSLLAILRLMPVLLCLAALPPAIRGQVSATSPLPTSAGSERREGLIGQTYTFLDLSYVDQKDGPGHTFGPTLGSNLAVTDYADVTANFSYSRQSQWPDDGSLYQIGVDTTIYHRIKRVKPFLLIGIGYQWSSAPTGSDVSTWNAGGGLEVMLADRTALNVKAIAVGSLQSKFESEWQYTAGINRWLNASTALTVSVNYTRNLAIGYTLGLRRAF